MECGVWKAERKGYKMAKTIARRLAQAALAAVVGLGCAGSAAALALAESHADARPACAAQKAGWKKSGGKWWYAHAGSGYAKGWELIDGKWYLFDSSGWMQAGWQERGGKWYWLGKSGAMKTGWQKVGGSWYHFKPSGAMQTGWMQEGDRWYYLDPAGRMSTGWRSVKNKWYYFNANGSMATAWKKVDGSWRYFGSNGAMKTGWRLIEGKWYHFSGSGAMASNGYVGDSYVDSSGEWVENYSEYLRKARAFVDDPRFSHGKAWGGGQLPKLADSYYTDCAAYCCDFAKYVSGYDEYPVYEHVRDEEAGEDRVLVNGYDDAREITSGDVVDMGFHAFVVIERNGSKLLTAEGNCSGKVRVTDKAYSVRGNTLYSWGRPMPFVRGYRLWNLEAL